MAAQDQKEAGDQVFVPDERQKDDAQHILVFGITVVFPYQAWVEGLHEDCEDAAGS